MSIIDASDEPLEVQPNALRMPLHRACLSAPGLRCWLLNSTPPSDTWAKGHSLPDRDHLRRFGLDLDDKGHARAQHSPAGLIPHDDQPYPSAAMDGDLVADPVGKGTLGLDERRLDPVELNALRILEDGGLTLVHVEIVAWHVLHIGQRSRKA